MTEKWFTGMLNNNQTKKKSDDLEPLPSIFSESILICSNDDLKLSMAHCLRFSGEQFRTNSPLRFEHHANMSVSCRPPYIPLLLLYSKIGVYRGINLGFTGVYIIFYFCSKT